MIEQVFETSVERVKPMNYSSKGTIGRLAEISSALEEAEMAYERWQLKLHTLQDEIHLRGKDLGNISHLHTQRTAEVSRLQDIELDLNAKLIELNTRHELTAQRLQANEKSLVQEEGRLGQLQLQILQCEKTKQFLENHSESIENKILIKNAEYVLLEERNQSLKSLAQESAEELTRNQLRSESLGNDIARHEKKLHDLVTTITQHEVLGSQVDNSLQRKQSQLSELFQAEQQFKALILELDARHQHLDQSLGDLTKQCREGEAALSFTRRAITEERLRLQQLQESSRDQHAELESCLTQVAHTQAAIERINAEEASTRAQLDHRVQELFHVDTKLAEALNQLEKESARHEAMLIAVSDLQGRQKDAENALRLQKTEFSAMSMKQAELATILDALQVQIPALETDRESLLTEIKSLQEGSDLATDTLLRQQAELATVEKQLKLSRDEHLNLEQRASDLKLFISKSLEEKALLEQKVDGLAELAGLHEKQNAEACIQIKSLRQEKVDLEIAIQHLHQQSADASQQLEGRQREIQSATAGLKTAMEQMRLEEERKAALQHEVEKLAALQQSQIAVQKELDAHVLSCRIEHETTKRNVDQAKLEFEGILDSLSNAKDEFTEGTHQLSQLRIQLSEVRSSLADARGELDSTRHLLTADQIKLSAAQGALTTINEELQLGHNLKLSAEALREVNRKASQAEQHLSSLNHQLSEATEHRLQLDASLMETKADLTSTSMRCDALHRQEGELRTVLEQAKSQEQKMLAALGMITASVENEKNRYQELCSINSESQKIYNHLNTDLQTARRSIRSIAETLICIEDWGNRMVSCLVRIGSAPQNPLELRNLNDEFEMILGALHRLIDSVNKSKVPQSLEQIQSLAGLAHAEDQASANGPASAADIPPQHEDWRKDLKRAEIQNILLHHKNSRHQSRQRMLNKRTAFKRSIALKSPGLPPVKTATA